MKKFFTAFLTIIYILVSLSSSIVYAEETVIAKGVKGELKEVGYDTDGEYEVISLKVEGFTDYSWMELADPLRIVVDLKNTAAPGRQQTLKTGGKLVESVRYAQFTPSTGRVVLDVKEGYDFTISADETGLNIYVYEKRSQAIYNEKKAIFFNNESGISFIKDGVYDAISLTLGKYEGYKVSRLTNPERLVLTIPDAGVVSSEKQAVTGGGSIKAISYKRVGRSGASITLSLNGQYQYTFSEADNRLVMTVYRPTYRNITYHGSGDRVYLTLDNAALTEGDKDLKNLYTAKYDKSGKQYTVTFKSTQAKLGEGILDINDAYLKSFEVRTNEEEGTTSLVFNGVSRNSYLVYTRKSGVTAITIIKPAADDDRLVVIDPGHGGSATGTIYGKLTEKEYNLDISKRLNALLRSKGVKTYMMRSEDCDVDNYERSYIANMLNAGLYLSVHINAMDSKSYSGTMTLYCPSDSRSFNGKSFAGIVQKNLISKLKTIDRGLRSRSDLIVLRETNMPAVIAEIAFMTNSTDRTNLQKESFRQKAAQALYDSVMQSLPKL